MSEEKYFITQCTDDELLNDDSHDINIEGENILESNTDFYETILESTTGEDTSLVTSATNSIVPDLNVGNNESSAVGNNTPMESSAGAETDIVGETMSSANEQETLVAYVHDVTEIRTAEENSEVKFYNMQLQSPDKNYRSVSYREDLHESFRNAATTKSPIKLTGIKRKLNYYDSTKEDIEVSKLTVFNVMNTADFSYAEDDAMPTIKEVLDKENREKVTVTAYLKQSDRPVVRQKTRNGKIVNKKEISANDNTGMIKITLWGSRINAVPTDGVYKIKNAFINEYLGTKSLNTNGLTTFIPSKEKIDPSKVTMVDLAVQRFQFPPIFLADLDIKFNCPRCSKHATKGDSKLFKCSGCNVVLLSANLEQHFTFKLVFQTEFGNKYVLMNKKNIKDYFNLRRLAIPNSEAELLEAMLTDSDISVVTDSRNNVIKFEY